MASQIWAQDNFNKGELSPYMYARCGVGGYHNALKTAQNVICFPQGGAGKRFGTYYRATLTGFTAYTQIYFLTFQYLNETVYQILFVPNQIQIFLEGMLVATVATTFDATSVYNLDYTILDDALVVTAEGFQPQELLRSPNAGNVITAASANTLTLTSAITAGLVLPVRFTTSGALPTSSPQLKIGITYFVNNISTSQVMVFANSLDAANLTNPILITNNGSGTNTLIPQNTWTFTNVIFKNLPIYDFDGGYDAITFTPSAISGASATVTVSSTYSPGLSSRFVGGAFIGNAGIGRIVSVTDSTHFVIAIEKAFYDTAAIAGRLSLLAEPAWSTIRGWPIKCSSYQNRACFANTDSLPNGFWASSTNDYSDFNDTQTDDDSAISWFPTSDEINYINYIVPYRSITVHTNSGVYSSPLSSNNAITPTNFSLQLNDTNPADNLKPRGIDNQIIVSSGNDIYSLVWDGINNAYTSRIVSLQNEQVIRSPVDEAAYVNLTRAGSRYVFIVNANGSMAIYQTLLTEEIEGWTPLVIEQSFGNSYFRAVATSLTGRGWFVTERQIVVSGSTYNISAVSGAILTTSTSSNFSTTAPTAVKFATTGTLPTSIPPLIAGIYYWVLGIDATHVNVYDNLADAEAQTNPLIFSALGSNSTITSWPLTTTFFLEELTYDTFLDCAIKYSGTPTTTISNVPQFNAQEVAMVGDGFGFTALGNNSQVVFTAHGSAVPVSNAFVGFPINLIIEPLPLTPPPDKTTTLTRPKHVRNVMFMFNNTIGGTINGVPIALDDFNQANIGQPPFPASGLFEFGTMAGWDDFKQPPFVIEHSDPFDIQLLGIFYRVDI